MTAPRIYVEVPLSPGARIVLNEAQSRYVGTVMRLGPGASVRIFNGVDGEFEARIVATDKRSVTLEAAAQLRTQGMSPDLLLLFAPLKRHATDLIVEKATELGVRALRPVLTKRTVAETVRLDRLRTIAMEAAEQTERLDLPEIFEPLPLPKALDGWDAARALIYADESGDDGAAPWGGAEGRGGSLLAALESLQTDRMALLIGPEGGFDPEERRMLRLLPFVTPVSLGPRILRAETAAISALTLIQAGWGDWR